MYYFNRLENEIKDKGTRYSPRIHRQFLPFQVVMDHDKDKSTSVYIRAMIHALREIHDVPVGNADVKKKLLDIWTPAFNMFSKVLSKLGFQGSSELPIEKRLIKQLEMLKFNIFKSYYTRYGDSTVQSLSTLVVTLSDLLSDSARKRMKKINRLQRQHGVVIDAANAEIAAEDFIENIADVVKAYKESGILYTKQYFNSFAILYELRGDTILAIRDTHADPDYVLRLLKRDLNNLAEKSYASSIPGMKYYMRWRPERYDGNVSYTSFFK